MQLRDAP